MSGIFEVTDRADGKGRCLRQLTPRAGIHWTYDPEPEAFLGSAEWRDYAVAADVLIEKTGSVGVFGRISLLAAGSEVARWLLFQDRSRWNMGVEDP